MVFRWWPGGQVLRLTSGGGGEIGQFAVFWRKEGFTSYYGVPLVAKGQLKGVLRFVPVPFELREWQISSDPARKPPLPLTMGLFEELQRVMPSCSGYDATLEGWVRALDLRIRKLKVTRSECQTVRLARAMGVTRIPQAYPARRLAA
jgi:hypothetical protein